MNPFQSDGHLTDEALLLLQEEELSSETLPKATAHIEACAACRGRSGSLYAVQDTVLSGLHGRGNDIPLAGAARARLQTALAKETAAGRLLPLRPASLLSSRIIWRVAAIAVLVLLSVTFRQAYRPLQDRMAAHEETGPEPDHALTPGATNPVGLSQLCSLNDDDLDPKVSAEKADAVFRAYGMDEKAARAYQVDYLINPQLGGNDQIENLWPEPYHATVWNATAKDALEMRLHRMVCDKQIDLESAQRELATDWIAAYKKYFHTSRPVSTVAAVDRSASAILP
jgi:hypothetical protein